MVKRERNIRPFPKANKSIYKWSEKGGEYSAKCPSCKTQMYAPTLKLIKKQFTSHTKSKDCLGGY